MTARNNFDVALVYDFDGTLSPGNMQEFGFVQAVGKDPTQFWEKVGFIVDPKWNTQQLGNKLVNYINQK